MDSVQPLSVLALKLNCFSALRAVLWACPLAYPVLDHSFLVFVSGLERPAVLGWGHSPQCCDPGLDFVVVETKVKVLKFDYILGNIITVSLYAFKCV